MNTNACYSTCETVRVVIRRSDVRKRRKKRRSMNTNACYSTCETVRVMHRKGFLRRFGTQRSASGRCSSVDVSSMADHSVA